MDPALPAHPAVLAIASGSLPRAPRRSSPRATDTAGIDLHSSALARDGCDPISGVAMRFASDGEDMLERAAAAG